MIKHTFKSGQEMYDCIDDGKDLYNLETREYVFIYNDMGSIAIYCLDLEDAEELARNAGSGDSFEYWGAQLGPGGEIADTAEYKAENPDEFGDDRKDEALEFCNEKYNIGTWVQADETFLEEGVTDPQERIRRETWYVVGDKYALDAVAEYADQMDVDIQYC